MELNELPTDPAMLLSVVNMHLRDSYGGSVEAMCDDWNIPVEEFIALMARAGWEWNHEAGKFW